MQPEPELEFFQRYVNGAQGPAQGPVSSEKPSDSPKLLIFRHRRPKLAPSCSMPLEMLRLKGKGRRGNCV